MRPEHALFLALIMAVAGYLIGHADAKRTWEKMRERFALHVGELETRVIGLQRRLSRDPERAAMDHGEIFVINQIENLTRQMRDDITERQERNPEQMRDDINDQQEKQP